jgi:hypothetical protein
MTFSNFPELLLAHIAAKKAMNKSNYNIEDAKIQEFVDKCWNMLSDAEKEHYQQQIDNPRLEESPKFQGPKLSKLAFDLNRGLNSGYEQSDKTTEDIDQKLKEQLTNFKYLNLSNSALEKNQGIFQNGTIMDILENHNVKGIASASVLTALATFPSMEQLGYKADEKDKFIAISAKLLGEMANGEKNFIDKHGALDPNVTAAIAIYVGENFHNLKNKAEDEIDSLAKDLKQKCSSLEGKPILEDILNKLNGIEPKSNKTESKSKSEKLKETMMKANRRFPSFFGGRKPNNTQQSH